MILFGWVEQVNAKSLRPILVDVDHRNSGKPIAAFKRLGVDVVDELTCALKDIFWDSLDAAVNVRRECGQANGQLVSKVRVGAAKGVLDALEFVSAGRGARWFAAAGKFGNLHFITKRDPSHEALIGAAVLQWHLGCEADSTGNFVLCSFHIDLSV